MVAKNLCCIASVRNVQACYTEGGWKPRDSHPNADICCCRDREAALPLQALVVWILIALGLLDIFIRAAGVEHVPLLLNGARLLVCLGSSLAKCARLELSLDGDGSVAAEPLAHVNHAFFAFGVPLLQLLALGGERVFEGWTQTFAWRVPVDHYAVAILEAECQRSA
jgi:hypothetical protein